MPILNEDTQDIPVTVTLKAETLMQIMVMAVQAPQIPASEVGKIKDAICVSLNI